MKTPFDQENAKFSLVGHKLAAKIIYPRMFKVNESQLSYEFTPDIPKYKVLDSDLGIDKIVRVKIDREGFKGGIPFSTQERFRRLESIPISLRNRDKIDLTITEWNDISNLPSELYKLMADFFVYGIVNDEEDSFWDAIAIFCRPLKQRLINGDIDYQKGYNPRSSQSFICITFRELLKNKLAIFRMQ